MKKHISTIFVSLVVVYLLFLIWPAIFGRLTGTFKSTEVPIDYVHLEKFLSADNTFSRSLWVPQLQRFSFSTSNHPAISANDFFKVTNSFDDVAALRKPKNIELLQEAAVKYVIVPYDSQKELFLKDRTYDENLHTQVVRQLDSVKMLKKLDSFGKVTVYEVANAHHRFWSTNNSSAITYNAKNLTEYIVSIRNGKKGDIIVFSESYDKGWVGSVNGMSIESKPYDKILNSFVLPTDGNMTLNVAYVPQRWVELGEWISSITAVVLIILFLVMKSKNGTIHT